MAPWFGDATWFWWLPEGLQQNTWVILRFQIIKFTKLGFGEILEERLNTSLNQNLLYVIYTAKAMH